MNKKIVIIFCGIFTVNIFISYVFFKNDLLLKINGDSVGWVGFANLIHRTGSIGDYIYWPPIFPLIISIFLNFRNGIFLFSLFQQIIYTAILIFMFIALKHLGIKKNKYLLIPTLIFAFMPSHVIISKIPVGETFFLFLCAIHLFFSLRFIKNYRIRDLFFAEFFLILSTFTKPTTLYLCLIEFCIYFLLYRQKGNRNLLYIFIISLLLPLTVYFLWSWRNYKATKIFIFSNVVNYDLLSDNYYHVFPYINYFKRTTSFKIGDEFREKESEELHHFLINNYLSDYIRVKYHLDMNRLNRNQVDYYAGELGFKSIKDNLIVYLPVHAVKSLSIFIPSNWIVFRSITDMSIHKNILLLTSFLFGSVFLTLFIAAIILHRKISKGKNSYIKNSLLFLLSVSLYLMLAVGIASFDSGGRFPYVFAFFGYIYVTVILYYQRFPNEIN